MSTDKSRNLDYTKFITLNEPIILLFERTNGLTK